MKNEKNLKVIVVNPPSKEKAKEMINKISILLSNTN